MDNRRLQHPADEALNGLQDMLLADLMARWSSGDLELETNKHPIERVRLIRRDKPLKKSFVDDDVLS